MVSRAPSASSSQGEAGAKRRRGDPGIHSVTLAVECSETEFCTAVAPVGRGMDPGVCAASLRSLLRPRMTKDLEVIANYQRMCTAGRQSFSDEA